MNLALVDLSEKRGRIFSADEMLRGQISNHNRWRRRLRALLDANHFRDPLITELMELVWQSRRYRREICRTAGVCDSALDNIVRNHKVSLMTVQCLLGSLGRKLAIVPDEGE